MIASMWQDERKPEPSKKQDGTPFCPKCGKEYKQGATSQAYTRVWFSDCECTERISA